MGLTDFNSVIPLQLVNGTLPLTRDNFDSCAQSIKRNNNVDVITTSTGM